jgi:hypothetical protein
LRADARAEGFEPCLLQNYPTPRSELLVEESSETVKGLVNRRDERQHSVLR